jgi:hypothetical protein
MSPNDIAGATIDKKWCGCYRLSRRAEILASYFHAEYEGRASRCLRSPRSWEIRRRSWKNTISQWIQSRQDRLNSAVKATLA